MPDEISYLWVWFLELERQRDVSERGLKPLGYSEIMAWALLTDRHVRPHEVHALVSLDIAARTQDA